MAALRFDIDGEQLPLEPALNYMLHPDETKRRSAAEALTKEFRGRLPLFALITNTLSKDLEIANRWRGFEDIAASRHLANNVEPEVVDALVQAVRDNYPRISHRYYAMKAKWLGKERLEFWDRNAPIFAQPERSIPWEEARQTVLTAYERFSPKMAAIAAGLFRQELDRCADPRRQVTWGLRTPDRAERAPLRDAQLYGQAARRHDARP